MWHKLCRWILYRQMGWKTIITEEHPDKFIICLAPHTSNFDFIIGELYSVAEHFPCNFLMKNERFVGPLGIFFKKIGGIPVWRSKHTKLTDTLADTAKNMKTFRLCVSPEGTRSLNADWKKGFYYIALKAEIPILLYSLDYKKKEIRCTKTLIPNGDIENQLKEIKLYYKDAQGKYPQKFTIGNL